MDVGTICAAGRGTQASLDQRYGEEVEVMAAFGCNSRGLEWPEWGANLPLIQFRTISHSPLRRRETCGILELR